MLAAVVDAFPHIAVKEPIAVAVPPPLVQNKDDVEIHLAFRKF